MSNTGEDLGLTLSLGLDEDVAAELEDFAGRSIEHGHDSRPILDQSN